MATDMLKVKLSVNWRKFSFLPQVNLLNSPSENQASRWNHVRKLYDSIPVSYHVSNQNSPFKILVIIWFRWIQLLFLAGAFQHFNWVIGWVYYYFVMIYWWLWLKTEILRSKRRLNSNNMNWLLLIYFHMKNIVTQHTIHLFHSLLIIFLFIYFSNAKMKLF